MRQIDIGLARLDRRRKGLTSWTAGPTLQEVAASQDEDDRRDYDLKGDV